MAKKPSSEQESTNNSLIATNRQARYRYFLDDPIECGIVLVGSEVKALRESKAQLGEAWATIDSGEVWIHNIHIAPYSHAQAHSGHEPTRKRKLLLQKRQIERLRMRMQTERMTLVPLRMYFKDGRVKVELALGKGKDAADKRQTIAKRTSEREAARDIAAARRRDW